MRHLPNAKQISAIHDLHVDLHSDLLTVRWKQSPTCLRCGHGIMFRLSRELQNVFASKSIDENRRCLAAIWIDSRLIAQAVFQSKVVRAGFKPCDVPPQPTEALLQNINSPASAR
jgi:hypothetical protein